jgi:peptidoglycan/LPS O-acetylase OafA/YrhL
MAFIFAGGPPAVQPPLSSSPLVSATDKSSNKHIPALDGLRGVAVLLVFFLHYGAGAHSSSPLVRAVGVFFKVGWSGVDLFFVLSGFLITGILLETLNSTEYYRNFYARRSLRIFPIYYLLCGVCVLVGLYCGVHWKPAHLLFLVYLGNPATIIWPQLLPMLLPFHATHLWSLAIEEQFYCIWPLAIRKLRSRSRIIAGLIALIAGAFLARVGFFFMRQHGWSGDWPYHFILCRMDTLAVGALIAVLIRGSQKKILLKMAPAGFVICASALLLLFVARHTTSGSDPAISMFGTSLLAVFFGSILLMALVQGSLTERFLSLNGLCFLGRYSYGLYLYHVPLQPVLQRLQSYFTVLTRSTFLGGLLFVSISFLLNALLAVASFHFFEARIMKLKSRFIYG